jgi:hypothetical protein
MKFRIQATPFAMVTFTDAQWQVILVAFRRHYDWSINEAANLGGWLYGKNNRREFARTSSTSTPGEVHETELTFRQADTILKSMEMCDAPEATAIVTGLRQVLTKLNEVGDALNKQLDQVHE